MSKGLRIKIRSHFLDSGAFSLKRIFLQQQKKTGLSEEAFYDSDTFWKYIDGYAKFIKEYKAAIDLYANVDVIGNPKLTYRNQKYLEDQHGLKPIPVVHLGSKMKHLRRYIDEGYKLIGLGGLVRRITRPTTQDWLDKCFRIICPPPYYLPVVKVHGFGMTRVGFFYRYPWWSVDATTVEQMSRWGKILIPRWIKGEYKYETDSGKNYYCIAMNKRVKTHKMHRWTNYLSPMYKIKIQKWLDYINESKMYNKHLGFADEANNELKAANYFYYMKMLDDIPNWPFDFTVQGKATLPGFGLKIPKGPKPYAPRLNKKLILYMSGGEIEEPLQALGIKEVNLMMSYFPSSKKNVEKRFLCIHEARKKGRKN